MSTIFDYLRTHVSIADVIQEYVRLRPAGAYLKGPCPFHKETDASFTVSPDKGIFYCFGCHVTGDVIAFIARKENITQKEAALFLIDQRKITIPQEFLQASAAFGVQASVSEERSLALKATALFAQWIQAEYQTSSTAQEYCLKRGISPAIAHHYGVGYFPSGEQALARCIKALHGQGVMLKELITLGIFVEHKKTVMSPFEERILFPIRDIVQQICGFGGRVFRPADDRPKYYNSKESELFSKGKLLFGLDKAKAVIQQERSVFLVEGYIDCLLMASHGYKNTVATLGTACTLDHLKLIARYADRVYVIYDGDAAGKKAMLRLTQLCWEVNLELFIVLLPDKEDPASFLQAGNDLSGSIKNALSLFSFYISVVSSDFGKKSLSEKLSIVDDILLVLTKISDQVKQNLLLQELSLSTEIPYRLLADRLEKQERGNFTKGNLSATIKIGVLGQQAGDQATLIEATSELLEGHIIALLVQSYCFHDEKTQAILRSDRELILFDRKQELCFLEPELYSCFSEGYRHCIDLFFDYFYACDDKAASCAGFIEQLDEKERVMVSRLLLTYPYEQKQSCVHFKQLVQRFCRIHWKKMMQDIKAKMALAENTGDREQLARLFSLFMTLKEGMHSRGLI